MEKIIEPDNESLITTPGQHPLKIMNAMGDSCGCGQKTSDDSCLIKKTINKFTGLNDKDKKSDPDEKPGYTLNSFVENFAETPAGSVPRVKTRISAGDLGRHAIARMGIARAHHRVTPGLYSVGNAGSESPVLVTANYRLSFDALRKELTGIDAWILVLDTCGVNVWCASGKKIFSTEEVVLQIKKTNLEKVVSHRNLVLPQLSATGVNARRVEKDSGFHVIWGPVRAKDIPEFLNNGMKCKPAMRLVNFPLIERAVLVPVELSILLKPALVIAVLFFLMSGIGPGVFSISAAWHRGAMLVTALVMGIISGSIITPILLPFIPVTTFSAKGAITGLVASAVTVFLCLGKASPGEIVAVFIIVTTFSSYLAMNFTGATPITSPSGVEKELRKALPFQAGALLVSLTLWIGAAFVG